MMTLLFALFVVLYAMGVQDLDKLEKLKNSIQFAFNIAGEGKTKNEGLFDSVRGGGQTPAPAQLMTAQQGAMEQFLEQDHIAMRFTCCVKSTSPPTATSRTSEPRRQYVDGVLVEWRQADSNR